MAYKPYDKKNGYSYTYGVFPTLDLLKHKKQYFTKLLVDSRGLENEGVKTLIRECEEGKVEIDYDTKALQKLAIKENTYVIGVFSKYISELLENENHVVLVNPSDTGNLGTIIRSMLGFGIKNLAIVKPAVDIFDPKVIRSSMGSIFSLNFSFFDNFSEYENKYKNNLYPFMLEGAQNIEEITFEKPFSLILGNEGKGLDISYKNKGHSVYISHSSEIDSLNLSVAASIGLYLSTRTNRQIQKKAVTEIF